MAKEPEQTSVQRRYSGGQRVYEKGINTTNCQGNAKNHGDTSSHTWWDGYDQKAKCPLMGEWKKNAKQADAPKYSSAT